MKLKKNLYNELISGVLNYEIEKSKKDIFIENLYYVQKLLLSGLSTSKQIEKYTNEIETISRSCYEKYCKEFLNEVYEKGIINSLFHRNIKAIAFYLTHNENPKSTKLYNTLLDNGSLKLAKNKKDSSLNYSTFSNLLKEFLKNKGHENIITFDDEKINNSNTQKIQEEIKEVKTEEIKIEETKEIEIELFDNTSKICNVEFLKTDFVEYENSYIDNNILEKNVYYIQTKYIDKEYHFEKFKEVIRNHNLIENYSIIMHNNSVMDMKLYIYRYINGELILLKSVNAEASVFELDQLIRRARDSFFKKFDSHMDYIINA